MSAKFLFLGQGRCLLGNSECPRISCTAFCFDLEVKVEIGYCMKTMFSLQLMSHAPLCALIAATLLVPTGEFLNNKTTVDRIMYILCVKLEKMMGFCYC